jgi:hypothetical protein
VAAWLAPEARRLARPLVHETIKVALAASLGAVVAALLPAVPAVAAGSLVYIVAVAVLFRRDLIRVRQSLRTGRAPAAT